MAWLFGKRPDWLPDVADNRSEPSDPDAAAARETDLEDFLDLIRRLETWERLYQPHINRA